jgi:hypothetical protein
MLRSALAPDVDSDDGIDADADVDEYAGHDHHHHGQLNIPEDPRHACEGYIRSAKDDGEGH